MRFVPLGQARDVACIKETSDAYDIFIEVVEERVCLGHDIVMDLREIRCELE
jgi:hypothetical protein